MKDELFRFCGWTYNYVIENHERTISGAWWYWFAGLCMKEAERISNGAPEYTYEELASIAGKTQHNKLPKSVYRAYQTAHANMAARWARTECQTRKSVTPKITPKKKLKHSEYQDIAKNEVPPFAESGEITPKITPNTTPNTTPKKFSELAEYQDIAKNEVPPLTITYNKEKEKRKENFGFLSTDLGKRCEAWAFSILHAGNGSVEERNAARFEHRVALLALRFVMKRNTPEDLHEAQSIYGSTAGRLIACMGNHLYLDVITLVLMYGERMKTYLDAHAKGLKEWQGDKVQYVLTGIEKMQ